MCALGILLQDINSIYIILVVGPAQIAMLGLKPNIRDGHKCTAHYFLFAHFFLFSQKGWASILFKFQHGKQRFYGRTSNKKALLDAFSLQAHLRMKRFPLRNNFFKKKKLVETLLARDPSKYHWKLGCFDQLIEKIISATKF